MDYKRYIDAVSLAEVIENLDIRVAGMPARWNDAKYSVLREISQAPDADVEEVKHGEWVTVYSENGYHKECSVCGSRWMFDSKEHVCKETKRCYECGTKMGGRK